MEERSFLEVLFGVVGCSVILFHIADRVTSDSIYFLSSFINSVLNLLLGSFLIYLGFFKKQTQNKKRNK
jgi:hypothetical protein